ncbi:MAG: hypothetical protein Q8O06_03460 [Acetobacterium sp.]|nr:hypothetical protein [Acetobacterium sp.]
MAEITRSEWPDSITLGTPGKGGELKVYFNSGDLNEAEKRIDAAVKVRQRLLNRLTQGGQIV